MAGEGDGVETAGIVGAAVTAYGDAFVIGTPAQELTPGFPISVESRGIPVRPVEGADDDGADDAAMLLEPEPHMPDEPVDIPEVADVPEVAALPGVAAAAMDAVAGGAAPFSVTPPPS